MAVTGVYTDFSGLASLKGQAQVEPEDAVKEVARQFESLFVSMMLKSMRDAVPKDSLFGGNQMDSYQQMFDQQLALDMAQSGGIGLAGMIEQQLSMSASLAAEEISGL
ncbi:MAG: rod-binding protein [Gammaproteobacteria bacterium]|nr:rod-binding protein [Gammaproteobacteria bacterium]